MRALGASRTSLVPGGVLAGPWVRDDLWRRARAVPSLDLRFADNKSLVDAVTGASLITFTRASDGTFTNSAGVLQTASTDVPRFDHNPVTGESLGLLVEEQRTNLLLRSEEFDNASWAKAGFLLFGSGSTANATTAPNGTLTADLLTESTAFGEKTCYQSGFTATTSATLSHHIKPNGRNFAGLRFYAGGGNWVRVTFTLTGSGSVGTIAAGGSSDYSAISASITAVASGWYRVSLSATRAGGVSFVTIDQATSASPVLSAALGNEVYTGNGTSGIYLWGAQLEAGASPTSYIKTEAAAVTRSADVASITGSAFSSWYNAAQGTIFSAFSIPTASTTGGARVYSIANSGNTVQVWLRLQGGTNRLYEVTDSSAQQAVLSAGNFSSGVVYRGAVAVALNDFGFSDNGSTPTSDTSGTLGTVDRMGIGMDASGVAPLNGHLRRLTYFPARLGDQVLQAITQ